MAQRKKELNGAIDNDETQNQNLLSVRGRRPIIGRNCTRRFSEESYNPPRPTRREKQSRGSDGQPWKNVDVKPARVEKMKKDREAKDRDPGTTPKQERHDEQVEQEPAVTDCVNCPFVLEKPAEDWKISALK